MTEYRQFARTGTYHIFPDNPKPEVIAPDTRPDDFALVPLCRVKAFGAWTIPILEPEVPKKRLCKACVIALQRSTINTRERAR